MKKYSLIFIQYLLFLFLSHSALAQIYINELDSDTPGIDDKEFVEIRTLTPFTSLNGYVLVFFNGNPTASNANQSYYAVSLDGLTTDANGLVVVGSNNVSPVPSLIIPDNVIQNGEDAVAIYQGSIANFPNGTTATTNNLVHALAYDTSDPQAVGLMALLGIVPPQVQVNENQNNAQATESIQRKNDGTYEVKLPTPGAMNDGSGIQFNGITIYANTNHKNEGDTVHITFTTQTATSTNLSFTFSLNNGGFNTNDFTGNTSISIPLGNTSATSVITIVDDLLNEGDEEMNIRFGSLPVGYVRMNDNIKIRVIDDDFQVDPWGTPLQPTYGIVSPSYPPGYYSSLNGLSGSALKQALQNIIADSLTVRAHSYGDVIDILKEADHNPKNGNQVWLMYVESPRAKLDFQTTGSGTGKWNREHIYPQSRGGFTNGTSDTAFGINIYKPTNANDILAGHSDAHALRAEDAIENSTRNNKDYGGSDYNGPAGTQNSWRGDVARALFYMSVRYNGLSVVSGNPPDNTLGQMGDLDSLLLWNMSDPADDFEMYRNNYIYTWQMNRNPFIDRPELADYIFGSKQNDVYYSTVSVSGIDEINFNVFPNPASKFIYIKGAKGVGEIYNMLGQCMLRFSFVPGSPIGIDLPLGMYILHLSDGKHITTQKLLIE